VVHAPGGLRVVKLVPQVDGIPSFDGAVTVGKGRDGVVVSRAGRLRRDLHVASTEPVVGAAAALGGFAGAIGAAAPHTLSPASGAQRERTFPGGFARLVIFGGNRLAWHVYLAGYDGVVDATTGQVLHRQSTIKHAAEAQVFTNFPGAAASQAPVTVDFESAGWLPAGAANLNGPFVHAYADTPNDDTADAGDEVGRTPAGNFVYPFKRFSTPADDRCKANALAATPFCSWDSSDAATHEDNLKNTTAQTFYLANTWYDHLLAPPIGFDQESGNFAGDDRLLAQTDDSAGTYLSTPLGLLAISGGVNNANMATPPDGTSPTMQMYLGAYDDLTLQGLFRDYNNGDDAATVFHEYTHGLSSRLITNADGSEAVDSAQAGAMGEAWGDWYAFDFLVARGLSPDTEAPGEVDIGIYSDVAPYTTRTQGLDCPVGAGAPCAGAGDAGAGGYTYGDFGKIAGGAEVHADGEIWAETLWDLRAALVGTEGSQAAGSEVATALVTGGMRLSPPEPSFLAERDAIINADVALYGGRHVGLLWSVFAKRGMGVDASTTGGTDEAPKEGLKTPAVVALTGTLTATPGTIDPGETVSFDASSFGATSEFVKGYQWDFEGDGTVDQTTLSPTTTHAYPGAGAFPAKVTVIDTQGSSGEGTANVTVRGPVVPAIAIAKRGRRSRFAVTVTCARRCAVRITAKLSRGLGKLSRTTTVTGRRKLTLKLSARTRRRAKRRHIRTLKVKVAVAATPDGGETRTVKRTVRLRV
jgi:hypothetical protein